MRGLSAQELLYTWEVALRAHSVERAITILEMALPEVPRDELLALSVGQRDARLLSIREATFGSRLEAYSPLTATTTDGDDHGRLARRHQSEPESQTRFGRKRTGMTESRALESAVIRASITSVMEPGRFAP